MDTMPVVRRTPVRRISGIAYQCRQMGGVHRLMNMTFDICDNSMNTAVMKWRAYFQMGSETFYLHEHHYTA